MRPRPTTYLLPGLAIIAFTLFLGMALTRLLLLEQSLRDNVDENMLWVVTQAQVASHRFDGEINRYLLGDPGADPWLRFDVLSSRLVLLDAGPQRRYLYKLGFTDTLDTALSELQAIEPLLADLEPDHQGEGSAIHTQLAPLMLRLNRIANAVMVQEWEVTGARLDAHRHSMIQVIGAVMGILLSGLLLVALLFHSLRQQRAVQRALAKHRDQLEEEVEGHIHRYREAAEALAQSLERERNVSEFYRSFAAMVSHQFRTPLAVIDSGLQRLERRHQHFNAAQRSERYTKLRTAVAQMTRLVDSSLTASRLDGGQIEVTPAQHSLRQIVAHLCQLQHEASGTTRLRPLHHSPDASAWCDRALTEQILANLISNALKYAPGSQPIYITTAHEDGWAVCRVRDSGPGIPEEEQAKLFARHYRGRNAEGTAGIGLGLNIARHLARLQHGDLTLCSAAGHGTTFTLRLPTTVRQEADDAQP